MEAQPTTLDLERLLAHAGWLRGLARSLVADASLADDLSQQTWLAALSTPPADARNLRGWLARTLKNALRQELRSRRGRESVARASEPRADALGSAELVQGVESQRMLAAEVLRLSEPYRSTLIRHYYSGLSAAEIARQEGLPAGTVRWRLHAALVELRGRLDADAGGDRRAWAIGLCAFAGLEAPAATAGAGAAELSGAFLMKVSSKIAVAVGVLLVLAGLGTIALLRDRHAERPAAGTSTARLQEAAKPEPSAMPGAEGEAGERRAAFVPAEKSALAIEPALPEPLAAAAGPTFVATLVDGDHRPVAGGSLFVRPPLGLQTSLARNAQGTPMWSVLPTSAPRPPRHAALSAADGRAVLELDAQDVAGARKGPLELCALAAGHAAVLVTADPPALGETRELGELLLPPGRTLRGRVVLPPGVEPARVRVLLSASANMLVAPMEGQSAADLELVGPMNHVVEDQAALGPAGEFELRGVSADAHAVWAYAPGTTFASAEVGAGAADEDALVLAPELRAGVCTVEGRVLGPDEAPVGLAFVHVLYAGEDRAFTSVRTDEDGYFRAVLGRPDPFTLVVLDPEFMLAEAQVEARPCERDVAVRLASRPRFRARVQDQDGRLLAGSAAVVCDPAGKETWKFGAVELEPGVHEVAQPGVPFGLRVSAPGHRTVLLALDPLLLAGEIACTLELDAAVVGVVARRGEPVAGARVTLQRATPAGQMMPDHTATGLEHSFEVVSAGEVSTTLTGADGRFALSGGAAGWYVVRAEAEGSGCATSERFQLAPGATALYVSLELAGTGSLAGRVLAAPGAPVAGIAVGACRGDGVIRCAFADAQGRFRFEGLSPGGWQIRWCAKQAGVRALTTISMPHGFPSTFLQPGEPAWDCHVEAGTATAFDLDLRSEKSCVLEGETSLLRGGYAELRVPGPRVGAPLAVVPIQGDGSFRLALSAPGTYALDLSGNEAPTIRARVALDPGTIRWGCAPALGELAIRLAPGAPSWMERDLVHVRREPGGAEIRTACFLKGAPDGTRRFRVPCGAGEIQRTLYWGSGELVATVSVPAEGAAQVILGGEGGEDD